ncbi:MAG: VapC toxin family PIN domain ribonuclease, partial [Anaerolineae bacterium]|nr:VapC toxin family PIN domain ribonuclease [Anaerolineae bacterium]
TGVWISHRALREYAANASRPQFYNQPIPTEQLLEQLRRFRVIFRVAEDTTEVSDRLLSLIQTVTVGGKQVHNANIVATMVAYRIPDLLAHNTVDSPVFLRT